MNTKIYTNFLLCFSFIRKSRLTLNRIFSDSSQKLSWWLAINELIVRHNTQHERDIFHIKFAFFLKWYHCAKLYKKFAKLRTEKINGKRQNSSSALPVTFLIKNKREWLNSRSSLMHSPRLAFRRREPPIRAVSSSRCLFSLVTHAAFHFSIG